MGMHTPTRPDISTHRYIILIVFPRQQWLRERVSFLRYTYIACLAISLVVHHDCQNYFKIPNIFCGLNNCRGLMHIAHIFFSVMKKWKACEKFRQYLLGREAQEPQST
jgi:hypothetical protein